MNTLVKWVANTTNIRLFRGNMEVQVFFMYTYGHHITNASVDVFDFSIKYFIWNYASANQ